MSVSGTEVVIEDTYGDTLAISDGSELVNLNSGPRIYLIARQTQFNKGETELSFNLSQALKLHDTLADFILENTPQ